MLRSLGIEGAEIIAFTLNHHEGSPTLRVPECLTASAAQLRVIRAFARII